MLRNVCDCCGEIIDGEPQIEKEYPDATLLIDDEVVVMFENLCAKCRAGLRRSVSKFKEEPKPAPQPAPVEEPPAPQVETTVMQEVATKEDIEAVKESAQRQPMQKVDPDSLPNQVTKQFPIHLPEHPNRG